MKHEKKIFFARHINVLAKLLNISNFEAEKVYRKLRRIECELCRINELDCIRPITGKEKSRRFNLENNAKQLTKGVLGLYFNRDPRGYAIKIDDQVNRELRDEGIDLHMDMGGYGILAPDFN